MSYWERLKRLKMKSQQRRLERYRIIYVWKILEGLAPNPGLPGCTSSERRGRECEVPKLKTSSTEKVKSLREASFQVHGPRLFNMMPQHIRNMTKVGVEDFKDKLDIFLAHIPDQPKIGDLVPAACSQVTVRPSNSLVDQVRVWREGRAN